jgi:heme exporter protein B
MSFWGQVRVLMAHELKLESRAGETWAVILPFGLAALASLPLAVGDDLPLVSRVGPIVFWVTAALFGMQIAFRHASPERGPTRDLVRLLGVDPAARFVGSAATNCVLLIGLLMALAVATVFFYTPAQLVSWPMALLVVILFAVGLAELGTIAGELTAGLGARATLGPLLIAPLAAPLLIGATQATNGLYRGSGILSWLLVLVMADLILAIAGVLSAGPLEEAAI